MIKYMKQKSMMSTETQGITNEDKSNTYAIYQIFIQHIVHNIILNTHIYVFSI